MFDPQASLRRWKWIATAAMVVLLVASVAGLVLYHRQPWLERQRLLAGGKEPPWLGTILVERNCLGEREACLTCHPDARKSHRGKVGRHLEQQAGCVQCHGGDALSLDPVGAHGMTGTRDPEPAMRQPYLQAGCARCHLPGQVEGTKNLLRGAMLYLELGCNVCHPLGTGGRGGQDYGPDLQRKTRVSLEYLKTSIIEPGRDFPGSTMPSFAATFEGHEKDLEDLLVFVLSLRLVPPPARAGSTSGDWCASVRMGDGALVWSKCTICHGGTAGRAAGDFNHRCPYLGEGEFGRGEELSCNGCHDEKRPASGEGRCPQVEAHMPACVACHPRSTTSGGQL